jgi:predicted RNA-binding Zn ribbon-like protein
MDTLNAAEVYEFDLDGGRVCLDFVNTLGSTSGEHLTSYHDLVAFAQQSQLITRDEANGLQKTAMDAPRDAGRVFVRAIRLREALRTVFEAVAAERPVPQSGVRILNEELGNALHHARVVDEADGQFSWGWTPSEELERLLWPIARSAADVLTSDQERSKVRECGASDCRWLFLDTSKNRSRQWCSMSSCGNREKARRHYERVKEKRRRTA